MLRLHGNALLTRHVPQSFRCNSLRQQQQQHAELQRPADEGIAISRRAGLTSLAAVALSLTPASRASQQLDVKLVEAFQAAFNSTSFEEKDASWTKAIGISPDNAAAWSNRGTVRLQNGQWSAAYDDLLHALQLEQQQTGTASPLLLNELGNAEGALGKWQMALDHYQAAATDEEIGAIAAANYALAAFETGADEVAVRSARQLVRRDPQFLDMRAALTGFLWATGQKAAAEEAWEELQAASDGLGAALYGRNKVLERVRHRWPPRATAALTAFLNLSSSGKAQGYDLQVQTYAFPAAA